MPKEVVDYIIFLYNPDSSYINGTGLITNTRVTLTIYI